MPGQREDTAMDRLTKPRSVDAKEDEDPLAVYYDQVLPLNGDNSTIKAAVAQAELPPLLAVLSVLAEDGSLIPGELMPPTPPLLAAAAPQGGMSEEAQSMARELATEALIKARDAGWTNLEHSAERVEAALHYLTKGAADNVVPFLIRELGLPLSVRRPGWNKAKLAADRPFNVAIIGGGLSGIAAAHRLNLAGIDVVGFEKSTEFGGVWWNNTYPGCRLDTPNYAYSFSFAPKANWPQSFSQRKEIYEYVQEVVDKAELRSKYHLSSEALSMRFDAGAGLWTLEVRCNGQVSKYRANAVIAACGTLNRPQIPQIKGQDLYQGTSFHSSQWRHDVEIAGKRIAVVGTGASAFQIVPSIAEKVEALCVFQRTPPWMLPTPNYHKDIAPGMLWLLRRVPFFGRWFRLWQYWLSSSGRLQAVKVDPAWEHPVSVSELNERLRQESLAGLVRHAGDREDLIQKLIPQYAPGAKRMMRDDGSYVAALRRPNVDLVTDGIERLTETGIETKAGKHYQADVIVYATGFRPTEFLAPIEVLGLTNESLHTRWAKESRAYLGITVPSFPNLFVISGPNSGLVINGNAINTAEMVVDYVIDAIRYMLRNSIKSLDVREEVHDEQNATVDAANKLRAWGTENVATWYKGKSGRAATPWPYSMFDYADKTHMFKADEYTVTKLAT
jgi:4-hydroxyacetophenone monooxygenase